MHSTDWTRCGRCYAVHAFAPKAAASSKKGKRKGGKRGECGRDEAALLCTECVDVLPLYEHECAVCLRPVESDGAMACCGHSFHYACIPDWWRRCDRDDGRGETTDFALVRCDARPRDDDARLPTGMSAVFVEAARATWWCPMCRTEFVRDVAPSAPVEARLHPARLRIEVRGDAAPLVFAAPCWSSAFVFFLLPNRGRVFSRVHEELLVNILRYAFVHRATLHAVVCTCGLDECPEILFFPEDRCKACRHGDRGLARHASLDDLCRCLDMTVLRAPQRAQE